MIRDLTGSFVLTASGWRTHISLLIYPVYCLLFTPLVFRLSSFVCSREAAFSPLNWPRQFGNFLFFFFGGGAFLVPAFELFLEGGA